MVSEENRRYKYAPRKKHSEERKVKLKSILEKARAVKGSKIAPLTYKQRLESLESNTNNNNNSSNNNDVNNEIIPMLDFLSMRIDDLEDENSSLITKIEELKLNNNSSNNNNNNSDNEEIIPMVDFLSVRIDDLEEDIESIKDVNNVPRTDQDNNKLKDAINNINIKIKSLETHQVETKKDINEIFNDLNDLEDKLDN